jgi:hypothetical protein
MERTLNDGFMKAFKELNQARDFQERMKRNTKMDLRVISPELFSKSFFHQRLSPLVRDYVKMLYDASVSSSDGLVGLMMELSAYGCCKVCAEAQDKPNKVYICDFTSTKSMVLPSSPSDYSQLLHCVSVLTRDTELLNIRHINQHKSAKAKTHQKTDTLLQKLRKTFEDENTEMVGKFIAVLVWMLQTKYMNKYRNVHNSVAVSHDFNTETMLLKSNPTPTPQIPQETAEIVETVEEETEETIQPLEPEDIPDSWEDL